MPLKIIGLKASNVMGVEAITLTADTKVRGKPVGDLTGQVLRIAGRNEQGKTSFLEALQEVLQGRGVTKIPRPIRDGATSGYAEIETDEWTARRTYTENNGGKLSVRYKDGRPAGSPAALLKRIIGAASFDPMDFATRTGTEQRLQLEEMMKGKLGIDLRQVDAERAVLFDTRTVSGRKRDEQRGALSQRDEPAEDLPLEEETNADLLRELREGMDAHQTRQRAVDAYSTADAAHRAAEDEVERLENLLAEATRTAGTRKAAAAELFRAIPAPVNVDIEAIQSRIEGLEASNRRVREGQEWRRIRGLVTRYSEEYEALTRQIDGLDRRKKKALEEAQFPVDGLGFDEDGDGITFKGVPFRQINLASRVMISATMVMAQHPDLRIMQIRDGNALDSDSYRALEELTREQDYLVLVEYVDESGMVGVNILEGRLADDTTTPTK